MLLLQRAPTHYYVWNCNWILLLSWFSSRCRLVGFLIFTRAFLPGSWAIYLKHYATFDHPINSFMCQLWLTNSRSGFSSSAISFIMFNGTFYSLSFFIIQLHTYEALIYRLRMPVSESPNVKKNPNKQIKACHRAVLGPAHPKVMCYCSKFSNYITVTFKSLLVLQVICTLSGYPIYERAHNTNK